MKERIRELETQNLEKDIKIKKLKQENGLLRTRANMAEATVKQQRLAKEKIEEAKVANHRRPPSLPRNQDYFDVNARGIQSKLG